MKNEKFYKAKKIAEKPDLLDAIIKIFLKIEKSKKNKKENGTRTNTR